MGRLFWKFFISILLAQLATTIGVASVFWLRDQNLMKAANSASIDTTRGASFLIDAAELTLKYGGKAALVDLAADAKTHGLYVIDNDNGQDVFGRAVTTELRSQAAALLSVGTRGNTVRMLTAQDGKRYLVFLRWLGPRGPMPRPGNQLMSRPSAGLGYMAGAGPGSAPRRPFIPVWTIASGTIASFLFAGILAWYFSRPIRALRAAFEAAAAGNLAPRFSLARGRSGDELTDLGRDFDRMSSQLLNLMDSQRKLLHDVSHELRSPLARLQAAIGLAHQQPEKLEAWLERIERESTRMDKLIDELLTISRLEASTKVPAQDEIAVMDLIQDIVDDARFEAEQMGQAIELSGSAFVRVRGSPDLLWRAIENVVRNAIKHSPPGSVVTIHLGLRGDQVAVEIIDQGRGVPSEELEVIFAPFHRSKHVPRDVEGHGLGLAIARHVITAHRGTIFARNREPGGLIVTITLPLA